MRTLTLILAAALGSAALASAANAQSRRAYAGPGYGTVTAESRYTGQLITAPVRPGPNGAQLQLPGGTWIDCGRSCRETLRRETVDYWQSRDGGGTNRDGQGYIRRSF